jgi:hypothetical protein
MTEQQDVVILAKRIRAKLPAGHVSEQRCSAESLFSTHEREHAVLQPMTGAQSMRFFTQLTCSDTSSFCRN